MKLLLAALMIVSSGMVWANGGASEKDGRDADGGDGINPPNAYYNPDYHCRVSDNLTFYVHKAPHERLSYNYYSAKRNKVYQQHVPIRYSHTSGDSHFYLIKGDHYCGHAYYLEMGPYTRILDDQGNVVVNCVWNR